MAALKGRAKRRDQSDSVRRLEVRVQGETIDVFDRIAATRGISRAAAVDLLVQGMPLDVETGLPPWLLADTPAELPFAS